MPRWPLSRSGSRKVRRLALTLAAVLLMGAGNPATETTHVVTEGETLGGIANRAGVSMSVIAAANGLSEPYNVRIGQKLLIPRQRRHTVKAGETGFGIAIRYGVPFSAIRTANKLPADGSIRAGQTLIIPAVVPEAVTTRAAATPSRPAFRHPHDGAVLLGWRRRPDGGGHEGYDYDIAAGDMIRAAASGTVIYAGREPKRFGNLVVIEHAGGWHTVYGHLGRITVAKGEPVKVGERIALGGQSGAATRPELHFEIRKDRRPQNPSQYLPDRDR